MKDNEFGVLENTGRIEISDLGKSILLQIIHFGMGALTATASQEPCFSPLGIAFCSGTNREYTLFSCFGAMLGYIISNEYLAAFRYVMALIIVYILKIYTNSFERLKGKLFVSSVISFFAAGTTGTVVTVTSEFNIRQLLLLIAESVGAYGSAYLFAGLFSSINKIKAGNSITVRELTVAVISVLTILLSLGRISVYGISLTGAACSYIILCAAYYFKEGGGAIIGTGASLGLIITGHSSPLAFCYCVSGLFSGLFSYSGRVLCTMAYVFSFGALFMFFGGTKDNIPMLVETAAASLLFIVTPQNKINKIKTRISLSALSNEGFAVKNMAVARLKMVKNAICDMSDTVSKVSEMLKEKASPDTTGVYLRVRDCVCTDCASFEKCWRSGFPGTVGEFDLMIEEIRRNGTVTPSFAPASLQNRCIRIMSLCDSFNKNYSSYSARIGAEGRINEMRKITADQFETVCDMIDDMLWDFKNGATPLANRAALIKNSLDNLGTDSLVNCYEDENGNMFVTVSVSAEQKFCAEDIKKAVESVMERNFEEPSLLKSDGETILFFWEETNYIAECSYYQIAGEEGEICGDCFESFFDGRGNFVAVLSDGMGTGNRAAIDGAMASSMFSKLILSGFSFPCALKLVNAAMLVKSREESLATLDILKVNLYTGQAVIYKAGATVSLMKRQGKVSEIKKSAMPIGILRQAEFGTVRGGLKNGDVIVIMSDGAADNSMDELKNYIKNNEFSEDLSQKLCAVAKAKNQKHCDDITVATVRVSLKNR